MVVVTDYPQDSDYRETNDFFYLTGIESPKTGHENLSKSAPRTVADIERLMAEGKRAGRR